jgi:hypothetical protein
MKTISNFLLILFLMFGWKSSPAQDVRKSRYLSVPVIDLEQEKSLHFTVDREEGVYLGHPTTVLADSGKTVITVYPKGHGSGEIVMKKSYNGGVIWTERLPVPETWKSSKEVPTLFPVILPDGKRRIVMFSGLYPVRIAWSDDEGATWSELHKVGDWGGIVAMASLIKLNTGSSDYMAFFHDDMRYFSENGQELYSSDRKNSNDRLFTLYKTVTSDGGITWSFPEAILSRRDMNLCEPGVIRSPDGKKIALLLRENSRRFNSQIIFSTDEGKTWSQPRPLPNELNGDRHVLKYLPDGRIIAVFRDVSPNNAKGDLVKIAKAAGEVNLSTIADSTQLGSPTEGDWVGWVGTWKDLIKGRHGQYRIRFRDNWHSWDCCYPGVEILPEGDILIVTYGYWDRAKFPFISAVKIRAEELDNYYKELKRR